MATSLDMGEERREKSRNYKQHRRDVDRSPAAGNNISGKSSSATRVTCRKEQGERRYRLMSRNGDI